MQSRPIRARIFRDGVGCRRLCTDPSNNSDCQACLQRSSLDDPECPCTLNSGSRCEFAKFARCVTQEPDKCKNAHDVFSNWPELDNFKGCEKNIGEEGFGEQRGTCSNTLWVLLAVFVLAVVFLYFGKNL